VTEIEQFAQESCAIGRYHRRSEITMLVRLFAENFGAFRERFDLSMEATNLATERDRGYFEVSIKSEDQPLRLLRLAAIFGPNASGKSTIIRAAQALADLVVRSGPSGQEGESIRAYLPFRLDSTTAHAPSTLGCEVVVDDAVVEYTVSFTSKMIIRESVVERGRISDRVLLERSGSEAMQIDPKLAKGMKIDLADVTRPNATAISVAAQLKQEPLMPVFRALRSSLRVLVAESEGFASIGYSLQKMHADENVRLWALRGLLIPADIGIRDMTLTESEIPEEVLEQIARMMPDEGHRQALSRTHVEIELAHDGADGPCSMDLSEESTGTRKMLALVGPWYDVVHKNQTLLIDELTASLHPALLMALLDAFNASPDTSRSQLIFTAHDTSMLEGTLRRDQVYFTEKNAQGAASLVPLSDFGDRSVHNIRKRYLEGRYGGVPRQPDFRGMFERIEEHD